MTLHPLKSSLLDQTQHLSPSEHREDLQSTIRQTFLEALPVLEQVESRISQSLHSEAALLVEIADYLHKLGGKRIRPLLCVLSYKLFKPSSVSNALVEVAAGIELIHMATLLHDDIIDHSPTRRNKPSAFSKYGLPATLLTGDFLLVKAFGMCAKLDQYIIQCTEQACIELTEGELLEGIIDLSKKYTFEEYLQVIEKKTSALFWLASAAGAHLAQATPEEVNLLREFGRIAGATFQIVDDILDVVADEDLLGKPAGTDLKQKTPSLINILWLERDPDTASAFFNNKEVTPAQCQEALEVIKSSGIIEEARQIAHKHSTLAKDALLQLDQSRVDEHLRTQLIGLLEYTLQRCL